MELFPRLLILKWHPRKKISVPHLKPKCKCIVIILKTRMMHCLRIVKKKPFLLISPLNTMLNFEVDILSLQKLEYEMDRTDFPVDYIFFEIGYCGHPNFPYGHIKLEKATKLILSNLRQNNIHSFMIHKKNTIAFLLYISFTDLRKMHPERI